MYGYDSLKPQIILSDNEVECPVKDCNKKVQRQRKVFKKASQFKCPIHQIYISPSTFEYESEQHNILWTDESDRKYLEEIKTVKRESRIARENSEDAVSFNVFRYLQRNNLLDLFLSTFSKVKVSNSELILWSYSEKERGTYSLLNSARTEFGEAINRGSEPDIIIQTDTTLFFIEAKVLAFNETKPSAPDNTKKYLTGGNNWFKKVFSSDYSSIAIEQEKYELLRFWLLGTWMSYRIGLKFSLISLVLGNRELEIEEVFDKMIVEDKEKQFDRISWEDIYHFIVTNKIESNDYKIIIDYYKNKCLGYNSSQSLIKAFSI
ncbi:MAG: hypothetical protein KF816_06225 [Melioribacteraceae bacterium]|nr:hypothetical protein [Melioribacteraceae bacterium]